MDRQTTISTVVLVAWAAFGSLFVPSAQAASERRQSIRLYIEESRRYATNGTYWRVLRRDHGFVRSIVRAPVESHRLADYDVVVIGDIPNRIAYTQDELAALERFVSEGGGLLIAGNPMSHRAPGETGAHRLPDGRWKVEELRRMRADNHPLVQVSELFGISFANARAVDTPQFDPEWPPHQELNMEATSFRQGMDVLLPQRKDVAQLITVSQAPVAIALSHGRGRVIITGAGRLFRVVKPIRGITVEQAETIKEAQFALLECWIRWLAQGRPAGPRRQPINLPNVVNPPTLFERPGVRIMGLQQLQSKAHDLVGVWDQAWPHLSQLTGAKTPFTHHPELDDMATLNVTLLPTKQGGFSGGTRVAIAALREPDGLLGILAHEVGHKLVSGCNTATSEGFAEYVNYRARLAAGFAESARSKFQENMKAFRDVDPTGKELDLANLEIVRESGRACQGKWMYIVDYLDQKYGKGFLARYCAASARRKRAGEKVTMAHHVTCFSEAAGEDLTPWFRSMGITVEQPPERDK